MSRYGHGTVFRRGSTWWIAYWCNGRQYQESSHSRLRDEAERLLAARRDTQVRGVEDYLCPNCGTAVRRILKSA